MTQVPLPRGPHIADPLTVHMGHAPQPDKPAQPPAPETVVEPDVPEVVDAEPETPAPLPAGVAYGHQEALRWTQQLSERIQSTPLKQILGELLAECNPAAATTLTFEPNRPNRIFRTLAEICLVLDERMLKIEMRDFARFGNDYDGAGIADADQCPLFTSDRCPHTGMKDRFDEDGTSVSSPGPIAVADESAGEKPAADSSSPEASIPADHATNGADPGATAASSEPHVEKPLPRKRRKYN